MMNRRYAHSGRAWDDARPTCEAGMGLGTSLGAQKSAHRGDVPGSTEDTNPLMERALRVFHVAEQVRFGWV